MTPPKHIWSGNWRDESEAEAARRRAAERLVVPPAPPAPPEPPTAVHQEPASASPPPPAAPEAPVAQAGTTPPRRSLGTVGVTLIALLAGIFGAAGTAIYLEQTDGTTTAAPSLRALPSSTSAAAVPKKGRTVANAVYDSAGPAVVSIRTQTGSGTGFLIDNQGTIVTNEHVIEEGGKQVQVRFGTEGDILTGTIKGADASSDLAVVTIPASEVPKHVTPLKFANSDDVRVGDQVIAIGNPFGLDRTLTTGVVSSLGRKITAPNNFQIDGVIQTDAAINPGNSGGPLLDAGGNVVGVNSQIATGGQYSQGNVGIGFAVPSNSARLVVPQLRAGKVVEHAWLGVETAPTENGSTGVRITGLAGGGPAAGEGGLRINDVVTAIDGQTLKSPTDLPAIINSRDPRTAITLSVLRNDKRTSVKITLGVRPKNP